MPGVPETRRPGLTEKLALLAAMLSPKPAMAAMSALLEENPSKVMMVVAWATEEAIRQEARAQFLAFMIGNCEKLEQCNSQ